MTTLELRGGLLHSVHWAFPSGALASGGLSNSLSERRPNDTRRDSRALHDDSLNREEAYHTPYARHTARRAVEETRTVSSCSGERRPPNSERKEA